MYLVNSARALEGDYEGKANNPVAPTFVRYWTKADKVGFWLAEVCPLMTQSGHSSVE